MNDPRVLHTPPRASLEVARYASQRQVNESFNEMCQKYRQLNGGKRAPELEIDVRGAPANEAAAPAIRRRLAAAKRRRSAPPEARQGRGLAVKVNKEEM